jgi:hypothetical protein
MMSPTLKLTVIEINVVLSVKGVSEIGRRLFITPEDTAESLTSESDTEI